MNIPCATLDFISGYVSIIAVPLFAFRGIYLTLRGIKNFDRGLFDFLQGIMLITITIFYIYGIWRFLDRCYF